MLNRDMPGKAGHSVIDPYQILATAIVALAAKDYMKTLRWLKRNPRSCSAQTQLSTLEQFFRSEWYEVLSDVDGEWLINRMKEEFDNDG